MHFSDFGYKQDGSYVAYYLGKAKGVVGQKVQAGTFSVSDMGLLTTLSIGFMVYICLNTIFQRAAKATFFC